MGPKSHLSQFGSPIDSLEERRRASSPALCSELRSRSSYALVSATILFSRRLHERHEIFQWHHTLNLELLSPRNENQPFFGILFGIGLATGNESDVSKQFSQAGCSAACRAEFFSSDDDGVSRGVVEGVAAPIPDSIGKMETRAHRHTRRHRTPATLSERCLASSASHRARSPRSPRVGPVPPRPRVRRRTPVRHPLMDHSY